MNIYEEYALLDAKMTELENQKDSLRTKILEEMIENDVKEPIRISMGSFSKSIRKTWTYTKKVADLEEDLKTLKEKEKSTEEATFVENPCLVFNPVKL